MINISEVAEKTGLTAKTIRFYEAKGVISPAPRGANCYRYYNQNHISELLLIKRSRMIGFSLDECRDLLTLSMDSSRQSRDVKEKAEEKLKDIDIKINELLQMRKTLEALTKQCPGDKNSTCPILEGLVQQE
ncbi:hypothetical SoxR, transcriptional regulator [Photobacterium sp. SKA34]|uniref:Cu(I)-responsive transcriptional regulator n=1 Tax=Photobacterium sp. SKA34 TaxID=121723 RepID=UPI00006BB5D9|nr:Cu(I)-responsive transcriptional regulator [Photobacterium sp. SKA34]EAR56516.1 hypothetical SoxR, transcriptional regulator [Photobacterium sp. SKA34]